MKNWTGTPRQRLAVGIIYHASKCLAAFALAMLAVTGIQWAQAQPVQAPAAPAHSVVSGK